MAAGIFRAAWFERSLTTLVHTIQHIESTTYNGVALV